MTIADKVVCCKVLGIAHGRKDLEEPSDVNSFHRTMCFVLTTAQCCALMPVAGVRSYSVSGLRFCWLSGKVLFGFLIGGGAFFNAGFGLHWMVCTGFTIPHITTVVFYGVYVMNMVLFLQLATVWPEMSLQVHQVELAMARNYGYPPRSAWTVKIVTTVFVLAALVESVLSKLHSLHHAYKCADSADDALRFFFINYYPYIFEKLDYNKWLSIMIVIVDVMVHFTWNYIDLFLMLIGRLLTTRFMQFNLRLRIAQKKAPRDGGFWREMREDFNRLSSLVKLIDSRVSKIVLLSFACNLYFICLQLLSSSSQQHMSVTEVVYYYISFSYLLLRTLAVSLSMAQVNQESKRPTKVLHTVPTEFFNVDAKRLLHQVITDEVAFTGLNFFFVSRKLLLTLAGTVITYEIVLVQLNDVANSNSANSSHTAWHHVDTC